MGCGNSKINGDGKSKTTENIESKVDQEYKSNKSHSCCADIPLHFRVDTASIYQENHQVLHRDNTEFV